MSLGESLEGGDGGQTRLFQLDLRFGSGICGCYAFVFVLEEDGLRGLGAAMVVAGVVAGDDDQPAKNEAWLSNELRRS